MIRRIYLALLCIVSISAYNQEVEEYLTVFQDVVFVVNDSILEYTKFIEENGDFYFSIGRLDSTYTNGGTRYSFDNNQQSLPQKLCFRKVTERIDTITSCFSVSQIYKEDIDLIKMLNYSYMLEKFDENYRLDLLQEDAIRLVYPCQDINQINEYCFVKLSFDTNNRAELISLFGRSIDFNGFQVVSSDTIQLKDKDLKKINKLLGEINTYGNNYCISPGNPWLLEFNSKEGYSQNLVSYHCFRNNRDLKKVLEPYYLLRGINDRNFNNCSK